MKNDDVDVLVTGATGLIGRWLLAALTSRGRNVVAMVRNAPAREAELRAFVAKLGGEPSRLMVVSGDVESKMLGLADPWLSVRDVYHLAARFEFGMTMAEARRANVDGTLHVAEWARARPHLRRFVQIGGYRMTRPNALLRRLAEENRFPLSDADMHALYREHGAYEASKHESALALRLFVEAHAIPCTVVHPSGVIGDSRTGETTQRVGLGDTIERLWQGRMPALVGNARTFVPLVTVDHLASILATIPERDETLGQELTVLDPKTPPLLELLREIGAHLRVDVPRHTLPVSVVGALPQALTGVVKETLTFLAEDRYDTESTDAHVAAVGLVAPELSRSVERWSDHLISTRFGAEPSADRGAMRDGVFTVGDPDTADVVYLHGLPWNGDSWRPVADRVGISAARLDLPGLGRSGGSMREDELGWLERALAKRTEKVLLVGHSLGAGIAVRYAHAHPEKVRGVVLVAPAFLQRPASATLRVRPLVRWTLRRSTPETLSARLLPELPHGGAPLPAVVSAWTDLQRGSVATNIALALATATRPAYREARQRELGELRCPVVLVHGENDPLVVPLAASAVHVIAGAGHAPHLTRPEEVAAIVRAALRERRTNLSPEVRHFEEGGSIR